MRRKICTCARVVAASDIDFNDVEFKDGTGGDWATVTGRGTTDSHRYSVNRTCHVIEFSSLKLRNPCALVLKLPLGAH